MTNSAEGDAHIVKSIDELQALYGETLERALLKEIDYISDNYRAFIEKSPFMLLASVGPEGIDCSPRGDPAGFVQVIDNKTVLIPDRRGNNRLDTLKNIIRDPRVSLLFLVPGVGETLRINGHAEITTDPAICEPFAMRGNPPRSVIRVTADRVYFQCPKALVRSRLWSVEAQIARSELPSAGDIMEEIMAEVRGETFDGAKLDREYPQRLKETIY